VRGLCCLCHDFSFSEEWAAALVEALSAAATESWFLFKSSVLVYYLGAFHWEKVTDRWHVPTYTN